VRPRKRGGRLTRQSFRATADSPRGADGGVDTGQPVAAPRAVPKARNTKGLALPAMTMEEVASEDNLMRAFEKVASNDGAPGPDRQSVDEVREHLDVVLPTLHRELLEGTYRPGEIRRVWRPRTPASRRAGCVAHNSGSVRGAPRRRGASTRPRASGGRT
jgi:hypothetical protein